MYIIIYICIYIDREDTHVPTSNHRPLMTSLMLSSRRQRHSWQALQLTWLAANVAVRGLQAFLEFLNPSHRVTGKLMKICGLRDILGVPLGGGDSAHT